jgi:zinc transport system substrate-binding protein
MSIKKKLISLIGAMVVLIVIGTLVVNISNKNKVNDKQQSQGKVQIVTTFYPMYIISLNLLDQMDQVEVTNLTDFSAGCVHDYQLTTDNMKLLSKADILVANGGGMEHFLEEIIKSYSHLQVIDSSQGISMLIYDEHEHSSEDGHDHHGEYNSHIWLDPMNYIKQIENVKEGLIQSIKDMDPNRAEHLNMDLMIDRIEQNAMDYIQKVYQLDNELEEFLQILNNDQSGNNRTGGVAIFHDTFAYLAKRMGLNIVYSVEIDSESALSAFDVAQIIDLIKEGEIQYLFADIQYGDTIANRIENETKVKVSMMNSIATGDGLKDSYLNGMKENIQVLKEAIQ